LFLAGSVALSVLAQEKVQLAILHNGAQWELSWPATLVLPGGVSALPSYQVQRSDDLNTWTDVGPKLRGDAATRGNPLRRTRSGRAVTWCRFGEPIREPGFNEPLTTKE
jgi:hypothetical protein